MIRLFSQLRHRILSDNKFSKYLLYAVGEVLLVVIGILLALQINNWNEERKESALERKVLQQVYHSIMQDTSNLTREFRNFQRTLEAAQLIRERLDSEAPYETRLDTAFAWISNVHVAEAGYTAYDRLVSIGVDLVKNDSLRDALVSYYAHSRTLKNVEDYYENSKYYRTVIYPKYFKTYQHSRQAQPVDFNTLKQANDFRIALDYTINDAKWYQGWSEHRKKDAKKLLTSLESYLGEGLKGSDPTSDQH
jgi:hypothetical protein